MKIRITMKTPDAINVACEDAARDAAMSDTDPENDYEYYLQQFETHCMSVLGSSEYITIVIDTLLDTASVVRKDRPVSSDNELIGALYASDQQLGFCGHDIEGSAMQNIINFIRDFDGAK